MKKKTIIYTLISVLVFIVLAAASIKFEARLKFGKLVSKVERQVSSKKEPNVVFQVNTDINGNTFAVKMYIPCKNNEHRKEILKILPIIKSDLIDEIRGDSLSALIEKREFAMIKKKLKDVINSHIKDDVGELYLEHFNLITYDW